VIFDVSQLDISGIDFNLMHPEKIKLIFCNLFVFHDDISGKLTNDLHLQNKLFILVTLDVSHLDISGKESKEEQE
jgi:hypothetical protein